MTSGRIAASFGLLIFLIAGSATAADAARILGMVAGQAEGRFAFVERRTLSLLDHTIEAQGWVRFTRPARLEKQTTAPHSELIVIDGRQVTVAREGTGEIHISLDDAPLLDALIGSLRATLAGDLAQLERHYQVVADGDANAWQLHLKPKHPRLSPIVESVVVEGRNGLVERFSVREMGGDRSVLELQR